MMAKPMKTIELHYPMVQFLIISDMCIPCCDRYTTKDSEAPEILSYEEISGVNISSEPLSFENTNAMGIFRRKPI